jgi:uncharacterized protein (TIGR02611 family)
MSQSSSDSGNERDLPDVGPRPSPGLEQSGAPVASVTSDAAERDWAWRRRIRSNAQTHLLYRIVVGVVGLLIVVLGLLLVPFPGPGWLIVILGIVVWASEFAWAQRLLYRARHFLKVWTGWLQTQAWWVRALALLGTAILVGALFWALFAISGVPGFFPDSVEQWLKDLPGLGD